MAGSVAVSSTDWLAVLAAALAFSGSVTTEKTMCLGVLDTPFQLGLRAGGLQLPTGLLGREQDIPLEVPAGFPGALTDKGDLHIPGVHLHGDAGRKGQLRRKAGGYWNPVQSAVRRRSPPPRR